MKILVVNHSCVVDLNQKYVVYLNGLPDTQVLLLTPENWVSDITGEVIRPQYLPDATFEKITVPVGRPGNISLHYYKRLPLEEVRRFAPDIVLSFQEPWSLSGQQALEIARRLNVPFLFETNQNILKNYPPPFRWLEQRSYRHASFALAYSEEARQVLLQKGLKCPSTVVPYAVDVSRFEPRDSQELRLQWGLNDTTVIGYMGRFVPEKGLATLLSALALLKDASVKLLMVGAGPEEEALRAQARQLGIEAQIVFTGAVSHQEAPYLMSCMDLFVLPSLTTAFWKEQFGRVIIEALACGIPVVGSDSGEIPNLIRRTGGGLIFPEGDATALSQHLQTLVASPEERRRLAALGQTAVHEHYTCEAVAKRLRSLCAEVIEKRQ